MVGVLWKSMPRPLEKQPAPREVYITLDRLTKLRSHQRMPGLVRGSRVHSAAFSLNLSLHARATIEQISCSTLVGGTPSWLCHSGRGCHGGAPTCTDHARRVASLRVPSREERIGVRQHSRNLRSPPPPTTCRVSPRQSIVSRSAQQDTQWHPRGRRLAHGDWRVRVPTRVDSILRPVRLDGYSTLIE